MFNFTKSEVRPVHQGGDDRDDRRAAGAPRFGRGLNRPAGDDYPSRDRRPSRTDSDLLRRAHHPGRGVGLGPPPAAGLLSDVLDSEVFRQRVLGAFLANTNSYEQLLCYTLFLEVAEKHLNYDQFEFGISDIGRLLEAQGLSTSVPELTGLASNLKIAEVFEEVRSAMRYRLAVPQLGTYCKMLELPYCVQRAKEQLRQRRVGIWAEPDTRRNRQMPL